MKVFSYGYVLPVLGTGLFMSLLSACNFVDNQQAISYQDQGIVNPVPVTRNFLRNNQTHRILLGVIDSGVDYNHPVLADQIHFDLDPAGQPTSAGFDFVGQDVWPSPYLARTAIYDPEVSDEDREAARKSHKQVANLLALAPELGRYLNLQRHISQEIQAGAYHGTHVAGLMVYDRPDFGLRSYRVLPQNKSTDPQFDYTSEAIDAISESIHRAAADGVRIVNMSLGIDYAKAVGGEDSEEQVGQYMKMRQLSQNMADVIVRYPQILFVVAAGNDGQWRDGENLTGIPCGLKLRNVLCVGALRENGDPAGFTNLVNSGADVVFALGTNVISTVPQDMCVTESMKSLAQTFMLPPELVPDDFYGKTAEGLRKECPAQGGLGTLSGTSMAAPLVAHLAAEMLSQNPGLDGAGLIRELYKSAVPSFLGTNPVYKLKIKKPSWYPRPMSHALPFTLSSLLGLSSSRSAPGEVDENHWEAAWVR
ncbi:MAG: hypothetical protein A2X94_12395 [Bdellovibrionales bacterium GWB1_55_8]|nr:MAG: hypothetical protein A2X94_12395 [Bdellovibrionales bacterium GWB1_55_8]